jgi:uncharacterized membrane protein
MSNTEPPDRRRVLSLRTSRMEALSDGIFAIASTLLVLDLAIPAVSQPDVGQRLLEQWPIYLAYLVSFATIGQAWLGHSVITEYLDRADSILLRLNLVLLFFVSALPYPTHMLAEYFPARTPSASPSRSTGSICWRSTASSASFGTTRSRNTWSGGTTPKPTCGPSRRSSIPAWCPTPS